MGEELSLEEKTLHEDAIRVYQHRLELGVAREQARKDLPLSTYTEAYWKVDLHNLFHFLKLRMDSHAQLEIRQYANALYELIKPIVPMACEAFEDYVLKARTFSGDELKILEKIASAYFTNIPEEQISALAPKLSKREVSEFISKILR